MNRKMKSVSVSISTSSALSPINKKMSVRTASTRSRKTKPTVTRRFQEFKRNMVANPEKPGVPGRKPYFIYEKVRNFTPKSLYDPEYPSISEKLFTGLPSGRMTKASRVVGDRGHDTVSATSWTSFTSRASRFSIQRRSSVAPSMFSFGLASLAEITLGSIMVLESDEEQELAPEDRAPSMFRLREDPPPRVKEVVTDFKVNLGESDTMFLLEIPSTACSAESEEGVIVTKRNDQYEKTKYGSKTISHTAMQTTRVFLKHEQLYVPRNARTNSSAYATVWDIYDVMEYHKRQTLLSGVSREEGMVTRVTETPFEEDTYYEELEYQGQKFTEKFKKALMVMERLIVKKTFSENQLLFRGLLLEDPLSLEVNFNYTLKHLWTFTCDKTKNRNVTSISGSPVNSNILAVGYGKFKYTDKCNGLVCIWNVKNPKDPERIFEFDDPVTYLVFSPHRSQILAVSFYNGLVLLVDVISTSLKVKASNYHYPLYYPVWQTLWFQLDETQPVLLTCGKDGKVYKYKKTKFFVSKKIMSMGRPRGMIQGIQQSKKCYPRKTLLNRYPSAEVIVAHPTDPLMYVVGTAEGFVYFCSINHRQDHIEVFAAHDGPIYNIQFNPFCTKVFLTCGADWSVRIWAEGIFEPLVTLESGMSAIQHALWDPLHSTVVVAVTGIFIEVGRPSWIQQVWDVRRRISVPKSSTKSPSKTLNTVLHFTQNKYNLCVGDAAGEVHVMALSHMPFSPAFQDSVLAQALKNVLVTRPDLLIKLEQLGTPFSSEEKKKAKNRLYRKLDKLKLDKLS